MVYAKRFEKDGRGYIIASGFYPESARYTAEQLVHQVRNSLLNEDPYLTLTYVNNPRGRFVCGSLYTFILSPGGDMLANGNHWYRLAKISCH